MLDPAVPGDGPGQRDLAAVARDCLAHGDSLDQAAQAVLGRTRSPVAAINAMRQALPGLPLAGPKPLVHRNLPPGTSRAAGKLWDDLESAAAELAGGSPPELTGEQHGRAASLIRRRT